MKANIENKLLAVVRIRGRVGVRWPISETMQRLNLKRVNNLTVVYGSKSNIGMIRKCNDFVTYGELDSDMLNRLVAREGLTPSNDDIKQINEGKKRFADIVAGGFLHMHPPRGGYEGIKRGYSTGGALGYRGKDINELINRML